MLFTQMDLLIPKVNDQNTLTHELTLVLNLRELTHAEIYT